MTESKTLVDYLETGYFGENLACVREMPRFWIRKVLCQEKGEKFFFQDYYPGQFIEEYDDEDDEYEN